MFPLSLAHHCTSKTLFQKSQLFFKLKVPEATRNYNPTETGGRRLKQFVVGTSQVVLSNLLLLGRFWLNKHYYIISL